MVLYSQAGRFKVMLYYRRRLHIYGRKGKFKVVIFMEIRSHSHNQYTINGFILTSYVDSERYCIIE